MKLSQLTRITEEDFKDTEQEMVQKLAKALNPFLEQISLAMSNNIDFDNLNQAVVNYSVEVKSGGVPKSNTSLSHGLKGKPKGIICVSARNTSGSSAVPTGTPFINFSFNGSDYSTLKIDSISGLPADTKFDLTLIIIG
jgi:hypothetical protein